MFTATNKQAFTNLSFLNQTYTTVNFLGINSTSISVNSGNTYFLPIEYKWTAARDRNPR